MIAAKNTSNLIPHCHPVAIEGTNIEFETFDATNETSLGGVKISIEAKSIGRTGIEIADCKIVPDEKNEIQNTIKDWAAKDIPFIFTTSRTGLGPRDRTTDILKELFERDAPGIAEAMRSFGQARTPFAMLSRSTAGIIGKSIVIALPGSSNGARESLEAILPGVFHGRDMILGDGH